MTHSPWNVYKGGAAKAYHARPERQIMTPKKYTFAQVVELLNAKYDRAEILAEDASTRGARGHFALQSRGLARAIEQVGFLESGWLVDPMDAQKDGEK